MSKGRFAIDISGKKFNRLTVISKVPSHVSKAGQTHARWLCKCECGNEKIIRAAKIKSGSTKSCGCLQKETMRLNVKKAIGHNRLFKGEAAFNKTFNTYKKTAKRANREFTLTKMQFKELTIKNCYYCDAPPSNVSRGYTTYGTYTYNGLDRVNTEEGYIIENVVPCCSICNKAKACLTQKEFLNKIKAIYKHLNLN